MAGEYKEQQIGEHKYRVGRFKARIGAYVLQRVSRMASMPEAEYVEMQDSCLGICQRYDEKVNMWMPIIMSDSKRFCYPDLEHDTKTVLLLTMLVVRFNTEDFFMDDDASKELFESLSTSPSSAPPA